MGCPQDGVFLDLLQGTISEPERQQLVDHMQACADCRATVEALAHEGNEADPTADGRERVGSETLAARVFASDCDDYYLDRGTKVGRYVIEELLGAGGMGAVYAARDPDLDRSVALKMVLPDRDLAAAAQEQARSRLAREARSAARINHPNVVTVHDVGSWADQVFIAMELVVGRNVAEWMEQETRPWPRVLEVFGDAGKGLSAAHEAGLVHRDFKPGNIMLGEDRRARVTDFGLARQAAAQATPDGNDTTPAGKRCDKAPGHTITRPGLVIGTPGYMAPEHLEGRRLDARADQFSFCVALYQALYGQRPFDRPVSDLVSSASTQVRILPPPPDSDVPMTIHAVIVRGLQFDPADRHGSMQELLGALDEATAQQERPAATLHLSPSLKVAAALSCVLVGVYFWNDATSPSVTKPPTAPSSAATAAPSVSTVSASSAAATTAAQASSATASKTNTPTASLGATSSSQTAEPTRNPRQTTTRSRDPFGQWP